MKDSIPLIWATYSLAETRNDMVVAGLGEDEEDFQRCYLKLSARRDIGRGLERELVLAATYPPGQVGQNRLLADWVLGYFVGTCWPARDRQFSSQPHHPVASFGKHQSYCSIWARAKLLWATNRPGWIERSCPRCGVLQCYWPAGSWLLIIGYSRCVHNQQPTPSHPTRASGR